MIRWLTTVDRAARIVVTALCIDIAGMTPLAAQQEGSAAQARSPSTTLLAGPRLKPDWPRFEPRIAASSTSARPLLASGGDNHTFVFSTLALVLIGVIVLLLVTR